ncbi:3-ketoacyl-CoA thiolase 2, peroxisomal [Platanthera guangdongensis]|uniref:acetyl-CoA C-acyltransferase n=1 Tax=Platanthera guangdongensis TaxID=2320717 RepID=A0ABR2MEG8_9ASPA
MGETGIEGEEAGREPLNWGEEAEIPRRSSCRTWEMLYRENCASRTLRWDVRTGEQATLDFGEPVASKQEGDLGEMSGQANRDSSCDACRTAICKANKGGFKNVHAEDLLAPLLKALLDKTKLNPSEVGDIVVGTVLAPGSQRAIECRMAAFYAGFPETVPIKTVNRQCSSGLQAIADVVSAIKAGFYDVGIGAGLESMTVNKIGWEGPPNPKAKHFQEVQDCYLPMGVTSENVAERYGITKEEQDQTAVVSHKRAAAAIASGKLKEEIVPVTVKVVDPNTGYEKEITISVDEGVRPETSLYGLAKLKPAFKKGGSTTAVGVHPAVMGIGPAVAIPAAVKAAGLQLKDIDLYEINEAFASQYVYCIKDLGLDPGKVNVNGGAIALGHPLGATGARCVITLLNEMKRRGRDCRFGIISMCIGSGMGAAAVFERGDAADLP